ncbi:hypothetical protein NMG60_11025984 [Bertholletia excelsa]
MAFLIGRSSPVGLQSCYRIIFTITGRSDSDITSYDHLPSCLHQSRIRNRRLSTGSTPTELAGKNAYELLGVSENSSFSEIKASFRKLAKETHPDLAQSPNHSSASRRFIQILAAYEILSDTEKRAHYDKHLLSQRVDVQRYSGHVSMMYPYESHRTIMKQMEVVEWLKWYRLAINDILSEKRVVVGSGYFNILERDFYSAIHAAFYGPDIGSMDLLPDCFEAEERSTNGTPEVLHLVSGRDLFGMVCLADKVPELSPFYSEKLASFASGESFLCPEMEKLSTKTNSCIAGVGNQQRQAKSTDYYESDAYKDLELHVSGKVVAVATRVPPNSHYNGRKNDDPHDHIYVYLSSPEDPMYMGQAFSRVSFTGDSFGSWVPLGTISGLGTSPQEGSCFVYDNKGIKTHVIMKHRTLLVKHMHWYQLGDNVSVCECRCSRARLPPSKFWLFEPRCGVHDIGGWYVETYGRDRKGCTIPSRRYWDGVDADEILGRRLHPAVYLLALAYRTLDLEDVKRRKQTVRDIFGGKLSGIISWYKKLL